MTIEDLLNARFHERGPLTVAAFMELALYHPERGYYSRAARRSGRAGDFFTSVDVGPLFGSLLATQVAEMADAVDRRGSFTLVEAGAGDGRLARDILVALASRAPAVLARTRLHLAERSGKARSAQRSTLASFRDLELRFSADLPSSFDGVLLANELLDAMPAHAVVMREDGLRELLVAVEHERFVVREGPCSSPDLTKYLETLGMTLEVGARAEISLAAVEWTRRAARALGRGFLVLIDYGHTAARLCSPARLGGSLTAYTRHRQAGSPPDESWLAEPGNRDITTDVNFTAIQLAGEAEGCRTLGLMDQTYFLMALASETLDALTPEERRAFRTLTMPGGLGSTMKVLVLAKGVETPHLTGCSGRTRLT